MQRQLCGCHLSCIGTYVAAAELRLLIKIEQPHQQNTELSMQVRNNTCLRQWFVGRFGGVEEATSQLLPWQSMDDLHNLEVQISDADVRTEVVCIDKVVDKY